jgi:hypothetical protein
LLVLAQARFDFAFLRQLADPAVFQGHCSFASYTLAADLERRNPDLIVSADWGFHNIVFALARPEDRTRLRNLFGWFEPGLGPDTERWLRDGVFAGKRVAVLLHTPRETMMTRARGNFLAFRKDVLHDESQPVVISDAAGVPLYEMYWIDGAGSGSGP